MAEGIKKILLKLLLTCFSTVVFFSLGELVLSYFKFEYHPEKITVDSTFYLFNQEKNILGVNTGTLFSSSPNVMYPQMIYPKQKDAIRIALLGGSSINYLGEATILKTQLEDELSRPSKLLTLVY